MKNFLAIFKGEPSNGNSPWDRLSKEEQEKRVQQGMEAWGKWMQDNSASVVQMGGPLGKTMQVNKSGVQSVTNKDCGYVVVKAETHEEAAKKFLNHPHFTIFPGDGVEVMECLPIPGKHE